MAQLNKYLVFLLFIIPKTINSTKKTEYGDGLSSYGPCSLVNNPSKFKDCQHHYPRNKTTEYCCFMEYENKNNQNQKKCVEVLKKDVDDKKIKDTIKAAEINDYKYDDITTDKRIFPTDVNEIKGLRCDKGSYLSENLFYFMGILFMALF